MEDPLDIHIYFRFLICLIYLALYPLSSGYLAENRGLIEMWTGFNTMAISNSVQYAISSSCPACFQSVINPTKRQCNQPLSSSMTMSVKRNFCVAFEWKSALLSPPVWVFFSCFFLIFSDAAFLLSVKRQEDVGKPSVSTRIQSKCSKKLDSYGHRDRRATGTCL